MGERQGEVLLSPGAVAAILYVTPKTVTRWAQTGKAHLCSDTWRSPALPLPEVQATTYGSHPTGATSCLRAK